MFLVGFREAGRHACPLVRVGRVSNPPGRVAAERERACRHLSYGKRACADDVSPGDDARVRVSRRGSLTGAGDLIGI